MKTILTWAALCLLLLSTQTGYAQSAQETARKKAVEAIRLEDEEGKFDEAIKLLAEATQLDPENISYSYELAYAYTGKKEYQQAEAILKPLLSHKDAQATFFQHLGNVYDYLGQPDKAMETYKNGLKRFPESGNLYLEMGNVKLNQKKYAEALPYYEKGIEVDPAFPSNYYWAAKIYCSSTEEVWGMIYGELFMNLERNSERTAEISKLLFDTYKSEIQFPGENQVTVSFSKINVINTDNVKDKKDIKLPFGMGCYEMVLLLAVAGEKQIDISSLNRIRNSFVTNYYKTGFPEKYPNLLFDYQKKIKDAGYMEAYNHWIVMKGDEDGFDLWQKGNRPQWDAFIKWFRENPLKTNPNNHFYRNQY